MALRYRLQVGNKYVEVIPNAKTVICREQFSIELQQVELDQCPQFIDILRSFSCSVIIDILLSPITSTIAAR
jgi:hypothetical protein